MYGVLKKGLNTPARSCSENAWQPLPAGPTHEYGARLSRVVSDLDVRRELVVR